MRHIIPAEDRESEMDSAVHGLLPGDVHRSQYEGKGQTGDFSHSLAFGGKVGLRVCHCRREASGEELDALGGRADHPAQRSTDRLLRARAGSDRHRRRRRRRAESGWDALAENPHEGWSPISSIDEDGAYEIVQSIAAIAHRPLNESRPVLETVFPLDGSRFEAVIPPVTRRPVFSLRVKRAGRLRFSNYEEQRVLTDAADPLNVSTTAPRTFSLRVKGKPHADILRYAVEPSERSSTSAPRAAGRPHSRTRT